MRVLATSFLLVIMIGTVEGQNRLFVDPDFKSIGYAHKTIAIIPFKTSITLRPKQMESLTKEQIDEMEKSESLNIQKALYSWFLRRYQQGKLWVTVQDVNTTTAKLSREDIHYENLANFTPEELSSILGVDAVILGTFETNKPMSEGASLALGVLFGFYGTTNSATLNMFIHNSDDGKVLVNYHKMVAGSLGSTPDQLVNIIMRKASRRIPYTKPKE